MNIKKSHTNPNSFVLKQGFTLVEMLIVAPIVILIIGVFISAIVSMTGSVLTTRGSNNFASSIQGSLNRINQDIKSSNGYLATNSITPLSSGQGYDDDIMSFKNAEASGTKLILNSYATTGNPMASTQSYVYLNNQPNPCGDANINRNQPLMLNVVYFVKNNTLWRRTIAPTNFDTIGCIGATTGAPWQQPSCAPTITGTMCKTQDVKLVDGIGTDGFSVVYYKSDGTILTAASLDTNTDPPRQTALTTAASANITINATKTLAGRNISKTGTIRSAITNSVNSSAGSGVITSQPVDKTVNSGSSATFSASFSIASATIQWQQSVDFGANWTNLTTSSTLTLSSVTTSMDGYRYRAVFTNGSNTITSSTATLTVNYLSWADFTLAGAGTTWLNFDGGATYNIASYRKTSSGVVILKGLIKRVAGAVNGDVIATLPAGYQPSARLTFEVGASGNTDGRVDILANGNIVYIRGTTTGYFSLDGIHFIPNNGQYTSNPINAMNGWNNFGSTHAPASYIVDNLGRVHLQGLMAIGTNTGGTNIFTLPTNLQPPGITYVPAVSTSFAGFTSSPYPLSPGYSSFQSKALGASYLGMQYMYYPAAYVTSFADLTLVNSWVWHPYLGVFSHPQYTKAADGIVNLKGIIYNGTATSGTTIATLPNTPINYRPSKKIILTAISNDAVSRIDITAAGVMSIVSGSNVYLSLDGLSFYAD